jgi:aspartate carbamoyltransferase catalytic subunit
MRNDCIIVRHPMSGILHQVSEESSVSLINAGDGMNEHPTQALLDMMTLEEHMGNLNDRRILIVGDILHSRVARSNIWGLLKMGAKISVAGPRDWIPKKIETLGIRYEADLHKGIAKADALIVLRIQKERQDGFFNLPMNSYNELYGIHENLFTQLEKKPIILHPGPANRGIELTSNMLDSTQSKVNEQVLNGIAIRITVLKSILGGL